MHCAPSAACRCVARRTSTSQGSPSLPGRRRCAGKDASYRLLMHPSGRSLVCGMSIGGLERVDLQPSSSGGPPQLSLSQGEPDGAQAGCAGRAVLPRQLRLGGKQAALLRLVPVCRSFSSAQK